MINPYKSTEGINSFFVDLETKAPLVVESKNLTGLGSKCQPDMDWIYNKCMMKSEDFRNMLEKNNTATYLINDPFLKKQPELLKRYKKRLTNSTDRFNYYDTNTMTPVFNNCALLYQELCRNFYETKSLSEEFRME